MRRALAIDAMITSYAFGAFMLQSFDDDDEHDALTWWSPHDDRPLALEVVAHAAALFVGTTFVGTRRCRALLIVAASVAVVADALAFAWHARLLDAPRVHSRAASIVYALLATALGISAARIVALAHRSRH